MIGLASKSSAEVTGMGAASPRVAEVMAKRKVGRIFGNDNEERIVISKG
jgi:hypothetical protein